MPRSAPRIPRPDLQLIEIHREDIERLPELMALLRPARQRFIVFCDDLSFDADDTSYKSLKTMLEGGIEGRPDNVIFYATSNRRHLLAREMVENERSTAINPGEAVEEKVSLSDRFGLWLGFHRCSQDEYLAMVEGYVAHYRIPLAGDELRREALEWATTRGSRSGRVAWQYVQDLAGRLGVALRRLEPAAAPAQSTFASRPVEILRGIDRRRALANLEVQLRRGHVAGLAGFGDHLAALDAVAALDHDFAGVGIGGDEAVAVAHQHQIAVALELVAGIGDDAVFRRLDRRALGHREIDAVVLQAVRLGAEAGDDPAAHRPAEGRHAAAGFGGFCRRLPRRPARPARQAGRCGAIPRPQAIRPAAHCRGARRCGCRRCRDGASMLRPEW